MADYATMQGSAGGTNKGEARVCAASRENVYVVSKKNACVRGINVCVCGTNVCVCGIHNACVHGTNKNVCGTNQGNVCVCGVNACVCGTNGCVCGIHNACVHGTNKDVCGTNQGNVCVCGVNTCVYGINNACGHGTNVCVCGTNKGYACVCGTNTCVYGTNECVCVANKGKGCKCGAKVCESEGNVGQKTNPTTEKRTSKVRKKKVTWGGELGEPVAGKSKGSKRSIKVASGARKGPDREEQEKREKELTGFLLHNDLYTHWPASWVDEVDEEESEGEEEEDEEQERFRGMYERMVVKKRKAKERAASEKGKNGVHVSREGDQRKKEGKSKRDKKKEHQKEGSDPVVMTNASVRGKVNGVDQDILIDTGAARSLVNITLLPKNTVWYVLRHQRPTKVQLTFAGGRTQAADGEVTLFFEIGGHRWRESA